MGATKKTLHLFCQIVGKVRMELMPKQNHWWHVPLYIDTRGLTTNSIMTENILSDTSKFLNKPIIS